MSVGSGQGRSYVANRNLVTRSNFYEVLTAYKERNQNYFIWPFANTKHRPTKTLFFPKFSWELLQSTVREKSTLRASTICQFAATQMAPARPRLQLLSISPRRPIG